MVECAEATARSWVAESPIAIDREMMNLTLQIVGRTLFSADLKDDAAGVGTSLTRGWDNPEAFDPDRWSDEATATRPKFAFFPFSAGTRVCIGEHFAMMEGALLLASLARQWRLRLAPGQNVEFWPQITLRPRHAIWMQLEKRTSGNRASAVSACAQQYA
jgi:cytochrome P450